MIVILMGVTGSGKTTIGKLLAARTQTTFADADDYHSAANKAKMAAGHPLTDEDRQPWLQTLHALLLQWSTAGTGGVLACSALKETYRTTLVHNLRANAYALVWLDGSKELIAARLAIRKNHYMNPHLLDSQFAALEPPANAIRVTNDRTPDLVVQEILKHLPN